MFKIVKYVWGEDGKLGKYSASIEYRFSSLSLQDDSISPLFKFLQQPDVWSAKHVSMWIMSLVCSAAQAEIVWSCWSKIL